MEEDQELKGVENVSEDEMLEDEWPSLSLESVEEDQELKGVENVSEDEMLEDEWPSLSLESVEEDQELKGVENVSEDEMLEDEWPSLSLDLASEEKELKEVSKKDMQAMANLKKEKDPKSDNSDPENDALKNSSNLLGELRFSDE